MRTVFITHCGAASLAESMAADIPVAGMPFFYDQFRNCRDVGLKQLVREATRGDFLFDLVLTRLDDVTTTVLAKVADHSRLGRIARRPARVRLELPARK